MGLLGLLGKLLESGSDYQSEKKTDYEKLLDRMSLEDPVMANVYKLRREGMSNSDIAERVGITSDSVWSYLKRAEEYAERHRR